MNKNLTTREINRLLKSGTKLFFTDADYQTRAITRAITVKGLEYVLIDGALGNFVWSQVEFSDLWSNS